MRQPSQAGFLLAAGDVAKNILIPRYYDPRIGRDLAALTKKCNLFSLKELIAAKCITHSHGDYVPKIFYGTGPYPYIRTSDLANWEIKASPKHGVPREVYDEYYAAQQVAPRDILFVHEGTYLIGTAAMVTDADGPLLYQHHLAKFTVNEGCPFNSYYLLAAFEAPLVHRQIRAKQFSADIIDSVVGRLEETIIPVPKDRSVVRKIEKQVEKAVVGRSILRKKIERACEALDALMRGEVEDVDEMLAWEPSNSSSGTPALLGGRRGFTATKLKSADIRSDVLLPKYYDPWVAKTGAAYSKMCDLVPIEDLVRARVLSVSTGDEIGRLNYGTGDIPFVRTSDFGSWELKRESKQGVSEEVFRQWESVQDVEPGDILLVRDGTYLVGTSVLVCDDDLPLIYCGGIYKMRSENREKMPPGLLFALLNTAFVRRQIRNKQFTRDVIDTLGQRLTELILPVPKDPDVRLKIGSFFEKSLAERTRLRSELVDATAGMF